MINFSIVFVIIIVNVLLDYEIDIKISYLFRNFLLGQVFELQLADWDDEPVQVFPPCCGDGELHDLYLYLVPPPQDRLQVS